jgi:phosphohistidine phosphatase SixA
MRIVLAALLLVLALPASAQTPSAQIPEPVIEGGRLGRAYAPLINQMKTERLVLLFRHDRTDVTGRWDFEPFVAGSCERQRGLSEAGRASARAIGSAMQLLQLPIRRVIASPYCRAIDSARAMFGGVHQIVPDLVGPDGKGRTLPQVRHEVIRLMAEQRPERGLLVLIGHHGTIDAFTTRMLDEGDALIMRVGNDGGVEILAHMPAARWEEIARDIDRSEYEPQ